jgi:hypothetical protein
MGMGSENFYILNCDDDFSRKEMDLLLKCRYEQTEFFAYFYYDTLYLFKERADFFSSYFLERCTAKSRQAVIMK